MQTLFLSSRSQLSLKLWFYFRFSSFKNLSEQVRAASGGGSNSSEEKRSADSWLCIEKKRESITHKAPLWRSVVIVLRNDRLLFQASIKAKELFHMSAGRANPAPLAPLAPPAAFYEQRTGSQQASSLSSINEEEEEERGEEEDGERPSSV